jgi:signal transduction histidine kinase/ligand-binding sensor domain-containing protein
MMSARHPVSRCAVVLALLAAVALVGMPLRALDPRQPLRQLGQQLWQTDDGLPQNTVHAIQQTSDGYLWLATDGGLVRFDGVEFTLFDRHSTPELRSNLIGALAETDDGTLWAATSDGLIRRSQGSLHVLGRGNGLPGGPITGVIAASHRHVWVLAPDAVSFGGGDRFAPVAGVDQLSTGRDGDPIAVRGPDGSLFVATARGVLQLRDGRIIATTPGTADRLAVASDGRLWMAAANRLFRLEQGVWQPVSLPPHAGPIRALTAGGSGTIYAATDGGLAILSPDSTTWKTSADGLPPGRVIRLFADGRGALWMSMENSVVRYAQGQFERLHPRSGAGRTEAFHEDREGNLWLGTEAAGLLELRPQRFMTLTTSDGLPGDVVRTVLAAKDGTVWAGTDGAGLAQLKRTQGGTPAGTARGTQREAAWQTFTTQQGLSSNTILALAEQPNGALAVGTPDGLDQLVAGHARPAPHGDSLPDDFVRSLLTDSDGGALWIGTRRGLARQTATGLDQWTRADGLGSDLVGALAQDRGRAGALWIGTRGGLSHLENGRITTLTTRDGLSSDIVTALYQDGAGAVWIGTTGGGLNLLREGRVFAFPASAGLPEVILSIIEDGHGDLWLGSSTGIYRVSRSDLEGFANHKLAHPTVAAYGVADGMRINECSSGHPAAVRTADGTLWFATLRGVSVTNPEHAEENRLPPPVAIENVTIDDQAAPATGQVSVEPSHTRLSFHYAGLSFVAPSRVRYRYRLEGFDSDWVDAGAGRVAYYTNVPPGRYTFRVLAANNDGVWNDRGAALGIRVLPHTWQTWWFRTLCVLAVLLMGYQAYRMRVRNVELRFSAVLAERTRIAREIHDTLAQDIVGISVQLELVSRLLSSSVDAARVQLDAARGMVRSSLSEARSSIWNLRSATSSAKDLPVRLSRIVAQAAAKGQGKPKFQVRGTYRAAPAAVEEQLLRVAQEGLNNAVRYARASLIEVTLHYDAHTLELSMDDDGQGFTYDAAAFAESGHFGLQGMRERAAEIGGTLQVASEPGKGTHITLRVDIP